MTGASGTMPLPRGSRKCPSAHHGGKHTTAWAGAPLGLHGGTREFGGGGRVCCWCWWFCGYILMPKLNELYNSNPRRLFSAGLTWTEAQGGGSGTVFGVRPSSSFAGGGWTVCRIRPESAPLAAETQTVPRPLPASSGPREPPLVDLGSAWAGLRPRRMAPPPVATTWPHARLCQRVSQASILDLHSGALSVGKHFVNLYR